MFVLLLSTGPPAYPAYEPQAGPPAYGPSAGPPEEPPGGSQAGPPGGSQAGPQAGPPESRSAPKRKSHKCDCGVDLSKSAEVEQKRSALELQAEWENLALQKYHERNGQNQQQPHQQEQQQNAKRRHKREATKSKTSKDKSKGEDRIVNGYEAETQPWLASIANCYVKDGEGQKIIGQRGNLDECQMWHIHCGGSLINRRYAL